MRVRVLWNGVQSVDYLEGSTQVRERTEKERVVCAPAFWRDRCTFRAKENRYNTGECVRARLVNASLHQATITLAPPWLYNCTILVQSSSVE